MSTVLTSFEQAAALFLARAAELRVELEAGLHKVGAHIETVAKEEIGHYQPAEGPFPAWAPLAQTTLEGWGGYPGKIELGYAPPDNPLLRTGEMRESIGHEVHDLEAVIGSNDETLLYQELGTAAMPPRPVLGPAAHKSKPAIEMLIGAALVTGIAGQEGLRQIAYRFNVELPKE